MSLLPIKRSEEQFLEVPPGESPSALSQLDEEDCDFCGKSNDSEDIPVVPDIDGNIYRLECKSAGRFCCSVTGIKFEVTRPVTLEFELDSWYNYLEYLPHKGSEALGSLFKVTTPLPPNTVSAVYLPHDLCLEKFEGDTSCIKCAHFKDGKLSVETPAQVLPYYVVLENPSFSSRGVFFWNLLPKCLIKRIPIHARVLLYFRTAGSKYMEYKMHLHFMPMFAPGKKFHQQKSSEGFREIKTPSKTKAVFLKINYTVKGPEGAHISPTELKVECACPLEAYSDITISPAVKTIDLCLMKEGDTKKVWQRHLSRGELEELQSNYRRSQESINELQTKDKQSRRVMTWLSQVKESLPKGRNDYLKLDDLESLLEGIENGRGEESLLNNDNPIHSQTTTQEPVNEQNRISDGRVEPHRDGRHFVDRHRLDLINSMHSVDAVLDGLLHEGLLTQEQYDQVQKKDTNQSKMRELYGYIIGWGDDHKDTLYRILQQHNKPLIQDLQNRDNALRD